MVYPTNKNKKHILKQSEANSSEQEDCFPVDFNYQDVLGLLDQEEIDIETYFNDEKIFELAETDDIDRIESPEQNQPTKLTPLLPLKPAEVLSQPGTSSGIRSARLSSPPRYFVTKYSDSDSDVDNRTQEHTNTQSSRSYSCNFSGCGRSFSSAGILKCHQNVHIPEPNLPNASRKNFTPKPYISLNLQICSICGKKYTHLYQLKDHMNTHYAPDYYSCDRCHKKYKRERDLRRHEHIHYLKRKYICNICKREFVYEAYLKKHLARQHLHKA